MPTFFFMYHGTEFARAACLYAVALLAAIQAARRAHRQGAGLMAYAALVLFVAILASIGPFAIRDLIDLQLGRRFWPIDPAGKVKTFFAALAVYLILLSPNLLLFHSKVQPPDRP
ncbi:MAG: hypothetical protein MUE52_18330 [Tabrizicola sp.]|nr:hypothetical protein [Tabrizicola sp.]